MENGQWDAVDAALDTKSHCESFTMVGWKPLVTWYPIMNREAWNFTQIVEMMGKLLCYGR